MTVGLQWLSSIRTFSSGSTTLLYDGVSMSINGCCCCCKGGFVKVTSTVIAAKVVVVVSIVIVTGCFSKVVGCCVGSWRCCLVVVCEQQNVGGGSCLCDSLWRCLRFFYVCWVRVLVQLLFSFAYCYFTTPNLAFLVLVRIHCDFNKFHFGFFKKKR